MSTENEPNTLNTQAVCTLLKIGRNTMYRLIDEGKLTPLPKNPLKRKEPLRFLEADVLPLVPKE